MSRILAGLVVSLLFFSATVSTAFQPSDVPTEIAAGDTDALIAAMTRPGTHTILLTEGADYAFSSGLYTLFGSTALPIVSAGMDITIDGRGAVLRAAEPGFRILAVSGGGRLTLLNMTIRDATLYTNGGAAILNERGVLMLDAVHLENNRVENDSAYGAGTGGALYSFFGQTTIHDSVFIDNYAINYGGGLYSWDSDITIRGTRFEGNEAGQFGGAVGIRDEVSLSLVSGEGNVYTGNRAGLAGGAFYVESGALTESGAIIADNISPQATVLFNAASDDLVSVRPAVIRVNESDLAGVSPLIVQKVDGSTVDFDENWWGNAAGPAFGAVIGAGISTALPRSAAVGEVE